MEPRLLINPFTLIDPSVKDVNLDHQTVNREFIFVPADATTQSGLLQGPLKLDLDRLGVRAEGAVKDLLDLGRRGLHDFNRATLAFSHD